MFDKRDNPCRFIMCNIKPGSEKCKGCGWDMDEHDARVKAIRAGELVKDEQGLMTLHVMGKEKDPDELQAD